VGNHRVEIQLKSADSGDGDPHAKSAPTRKTVPEKYNVKSELTCEVPPSGKTDANFELKSK
jgi:hypothetical protein